MGLRWSTANRPDAGGQKRARFPGATPIARFASPSSDLRARTPDRSPTGGFSSRLRAHTRGRVRDRSSGQSLVEFALVVPLLLLLFAGLADFGRAFYGYVALENAVKEGALYGARHPLCNVPSPICGVAENVDWRVANEMAAVGGRTPLTNIESRCRQGSGGPIRGNLSDCVAGDTYIVSAELEFEPFTPIIADLLGSGITIRSEARAVVVGHLVDPAVSKGLAPMKLVRVQAGDTGMANSAEIIARCEQPDPVGSPGYYRSPCVDVKSTTPGPDIQARFYPREQIWYKLIVRNNAGTRVSNVRMSDSSGWPGRCSGRPSALNPGQVWQCAHDELTRSVSGSRNEIDVTNTLEVEGRDVEPIEDSVTITVERRPAKLQVSKMVSPYREGGDGDGTPSFGGDDLTVHVNDTVQTLVWYKVAVRNIGDRRASSLQIVDSFGPLPYGRNNASADCDSRPSRLDAGDSFICYYRVPMSTLGDFDNTVSATSPDAPRYPNDEHTATVTVQDCIGPARMVVPSLIGMRKSEAQAAWTAAGFTGQLTAWSGANGNDAVAQNRRAFTCASPGATITIFRRNTP